MYIYQIYQGHIMYIYQIYQGHQIYCEVLRKSVYFVETVFVEYHGGHCQCNEVPNTSTLRHGVQFGGLPYHNSIILLLYVIYRWWAP